MKYFEIESRLHFGQPFQNDKFNQQTNRPAASENYKYVDEDREVIVELKGHSRVVISSETIDAIWRQSTTNRMKRRWSSTKPEKITVVLVEVSQQK